MFDDDEDMYLDKDYLPLYLLSGEELPISAEFYVNDLEPEYEFSHCTDSDPACNSQNSS